ncbi:hypothetical protein [Pedobacter sp. GR22-6]|uniref:hypothetical protein n=1 Tax=Pedobacter sp. GR22-6 TaxID=3127957 RepID=UPI00307E5EEF
MKKMLIIAMACYGLSARAQVDGSRNFIYLYSDSVIYAEQVRLRPDIMGGWQLRADSRVVPLRGVKFFNNRNGFFANTRKTSILGETSFSERIVEGKINLFQEVVYDDSWYDRRYAYPGKFDQSINVSMYYNKGYSDLKRVNYRNLSADMADHAASMDFLKAYRRSLNTRNLLYTAGGASLVASLVSFVITGTKGGESSEEFFNRPPGSINHKSPNFVPSLALLGIGGGFSIAGFFVHRKASLNLENAVDTYNR